MCILVVKVSINGKIFPLSDSIWCNPHKIKNCSRTDVLSKYKKYIMQKIIDEDLWDQHGGLRGKNLGCWCKPLGCNGDILIVLFLSAM